MNFLRDILLREFPTMRVRFAEESVLYRLWLRLFDIDRDIVSTDGRSLYFTSRAQYMALDGDSFTSTLAHEYVHLRQRAHERLYWVKRSLPSIVAGCTLLTAIIIGGQWLVVVAVLPLLPIYNPWVARFEFDAYRMSMLVRLCLENNRRPLPASGYELYTSSDASVRAIVDGIFSSTYGMQWAPDVLRSRFRRQLRSWRRECAENYFQSRLAFEKVNTYLEVRRRLLQTSGEPYVTVLLYLLAERERI